LQVPAVVTPADPATADGLTLKIEKVEADDTQTTITLSLTGRPELGRMSGPAQGIMLDKATGRLAGPPLTITDELGNSYHLRSWQALQPDFRTVRMTVDPMVASATSLTLQMSGQPFVAPAAETKEGERPPDPSAVIGGPWQATASEIQRSAVQSYPLALPSIPVAEGTFVPLAVVQTPNGTILRFRTEGIDPGRGVNFFPWATLIDATGAKVAGANVGAGWGNPADPEILEYGFASIHGQVTLSLDVTISHPKDVTGFLYCLDSDKAPCPTDEQIAAQRERDEAAAEDLEALIATQPKATWSFAIP
jgi:hypothetical protein